MGSTLAAPTYESANRLVLADLHQQIATQKATIAHLKTSLQQKTNAHNVLHDQYTLLIHKDNDAAKVIQRYQRAVAQGDQRTQDFLEQIETLQEEKQALTLQLANASQINCTFEQQLRQYNGLLNTQRKQLEFANTCVREKDQVIQRFKKFKQ